MDSQISQVNCEPSVVSSSIVVQPPQESTCELPESLEILEQVVDVILDWQRTIKQSPDGRIDWNIISERLTALGIDRSPSAVHSLWKFLAYGQTIPAAVESTNEDTSTTNEATNGAYSDEDDYYLQPKQACKRHSLKRSASTSNSEKSGTSTESRVLCKIVPGKHPSKKIKFLVPEQIHTGVSNMQPLMFSSSDAFLYGKDRPGHKMGLCRSVILTNPYYKGIKARQMDRPLYSNMAKTPAATQLQTVSSVVNAEKIKKPKPPKKLPVTNNNQTNPMMLGPSARIMTAPPQGVAAHQHMFQAQAQSQMHPMQQPPQHITHILQQQAPIQHVLAQPQSMSMSPHLQHQAGMSPRHQMQHHQLQMQHQIQQHQHQQTPNPIQPQQQSNGGPMFHGGATVATASLGNNQAFFSQQPVPQTNSPRIIPQATMTAVNVSAHGGMPGAMIDPRLIPANRIFPGQNPNMSQALTNINQVISRMNSNNTPMYPSPLFTGNSPHQAIRNMSFPLNMGVPSSNTSGSVAGQHSPASAASMPVTMSPVAIDKSPKSAGRGRGRGRGKI